MSFDIKDLFDFPVASTEDMNRIINSRSNNKVPHSNRIPLSKIKSSENVTDSHLLNLIKI